MGAVEGDKDNKAENRPVRASVGVDSCPVMAFQAAMRLREGIKAGVLNIIPKMVTHCLSELHGFIFSVK